MNKRKILILAMTLCMVAILAIGGTLAYFTDEADLTNTFVSGQIDITLDEEIVDKNANGDYVSAEEGRTEEDQEYKLHPGQKVLKDPTIHVIKDEAGKNLPSYIAAKITVTCPGLGTLLTNEGHAPYIDITKLVSGGVAVEGATYLPNWNGKNLPGVHQNASCIAYQDVAKAAEGIWDIYILMDEPVAPGEDVVLFDTIEIPANYNNAEMKILEGLKIDVYAYAVQTESFDDNSAEFGVNCYDAMKAAFAFPF